MNNLTVRPVTNEDIQNILILSKSLQTDPTPCSYWGLNEEGIRQLINGSQKQTLIAIIENIAAGIGSITQGEAYQSHLGELSVAISPNYRRRGLAGKIISKLEEKAKKQNIEIIKALIWTENMPSRALFESLGYEHKTTLYAEFKSAEFGEIDDCVYYKRIT